MLKRLCLSSAAVAALVLPSSAFAQAGSGEICRRGDDTRIIEVLTPGEVGKACDVRVTRDGGQRVNTPYHANADRNFCRAMAAELASELTQEGFDCGAATPSSVEASLAGGPAPVAATEQLPLTVADVEAPRSDDRALAELPLDQQAEQLGLADETAPETAPLTMAPIADSERPSDPAPSPKIAAEVSAPSPSLEGIIDADAPLATPVVLTAGAQPANTRAPRPGKNGAGRLVGAQPSIEDIIDVSVRPDQSAEPAKLASTGALASRSTEDVITGVVAANAAAWNEGNLGAFLGGYEQSGDVRLVADAQVVTGINGVRKYYEAMTAAAGQMGRLSFNNLDVKMTSAEVATVVGRFALDAGPHSVAGAMTIVFKQAEGRWRIVQDTRMRDAAVPTLAPVN